MHKILKLIYDEIEEIEEEGLTHANLDTLGKLIDIKKDVYEIKKLEAEYEEEKEEYSYSYSRKKKSELHEYAEKIEECVEYYHKGKEKYKHTTSPSQMLDGLEKLMYTICDLLEHICEEADMIEEKEIVHKHLQKMKS